MSYEIDYSHLPKGPVQHAAALEDAREYIADDSRFNMIVECLMAIDNLPDARMALSFAGIQGVPAEALWRFAQGMAAEV